MLSWCPGPAAAGLVPARKLQNFWGFQGSDFLRNNSWRAVACGKLPAEQGRLWVRPCEDEGCFVCVRCAVRQRQVTELW